MGEFSKPNIWKSYGVAAVKSAFVLSIVVHFSEFINLHYPLTQEGINRLGLFTVWIDGVVLYGALGDSIRTWSGESQLELLDGKLYEMGYFLGMFFTALLYTLRVAP